MMDDKIERFTYLFYRSNNFIGRQNWPILHDP